MLTYIVGPIWSSEIKHWSLFSLCQILVEQSVLFSFFCRPGHIIAFLYIHFLFVQMEAVLSPYPRDHQPITFTPKKQNRIKIPNKNTRSKFISNPPEKFNTYTGLLTTPHPHALSSSSSSYQQNQQPPLLPLPTTVSPIHNQPLLSPSLIKSRKNRRRRDMSLTSKKATKHAPSIENIDMFSDDSVFNLSPPPSSLPLPKFSVRSKLSCNAETTGVDTGATDNLRRLLRLLWSCFHPKTCIHNVYTG